MLFCLLITCLAFGAAAKSLPLFFQTDLLLASIVLKFLTGQATAT
jgi:hypothetical protein